MKNLLFAALAVAASSYGFAQTTPKTKDTSVAGKTIDTTLINRDKKNTVKDAVETKDHTKVTRQKTAKDTTPAVKTKKRTTR